VAGVPAGRFFDGRHEREPDPVPVLSRPPSLPHGPNLGCPPREKEGWQEASSRTFAIPVRGGVGKPQTRWSACLAWVAARQVVDIRRRFC
jgi:hypothetical protein